MRALAIVALLATGCAHVFAPDAGCTEVVPAEPGFSGWKVMECAHPFPSKRTALEGTSCSQRADRIGALPSPSEVLPCGWTAGYTDRATHTVYYYWYYPEALSHELLHVSNLIREDR